MGRGCMRNMCHGSNGPTPGQRNPSWFLGRSFGGGSHLLSVWPKTCHLALLNLLPHLLSPGKHLEETCGIWYLVLPTFAQQWCWIAPEHHFKIVHLRDISMNSYRTCLPPWPALCQVHVFCQWPKEWNWFWRAFREYLFSLRDLDREISFPLVTVSPFRFKYV